MSDTQVKATPSKAAMELAEKIDADWELVADNGYHFSESAEKTEQLVREAQNYAIEQVAETIQSALRELLEKAEAVTESAVPINAMSQSLGTHELSKLKSALEPWKQK
jgi:predicted GTPase